MEVRTKEGIALYVARENWLVYTICWTLRFACVYLPLFQHAGKLWRLESDQPEQLKC